METSEFDVFFADVLEMQVAEFSVTEEDIKAAISTIHFAYSVKGQRQLVAPVDYDNPAYRCAYLHKYAAFHANMVHQALSLRVQYREALRSIPLKENDVMHICCLGGGPGSDICGVSKTLQELEVKKFRVTMIDVMEGWASTFRNLLKVARSPKHNNLNEFFSAITSEEYLRDNLLSPGNETKRTLESADLITMIKFISALNQHGVSEMLKVLFHSMKHGAVVLFIDNASGGFREKISDAAKLCGFESTCDSVQTRFRSEGRYKFGFCSITSTSVAVQMWKKEHGQDPQQGNFRLDHEEPNKKYLKTEESSGSPECNFNIEDNQNQPHTDPCESLCDDKEKNDSHECKPNSADSKTDSTGAIKKSPELQNKTDIKTLILTPEEVANENDVHPDASGSSESSSAKSGENNGN